MSPQPPTNKTQKNKSCCESCEFYNFDDEWEEYYCSMSLDEDEMVSFLGRNLNSCPYYRFYDEYKSVQKQN